MSEKPGITIHYSEIKSYPTLESYLTNKYKTDEFKILGSEDWNGNLANSIYKIGFVSAAAALATYDKYEKTIEKDLSSAQALKLYEKQLDEGTLQVYPSEDLTRANQLKLLQLEHSIRCLMGKIYQEHKKLIDNNRGKILSEALANDKTSGLQI